MGASCNPWETYSKIPWVQNRNYIKKMIGKLLSEIWRIKGPSEQDYVTYHLITKKPISMHGDAQALPGKTETPNTENKVLCVENYYRYCFI
ncbi:Uncharacterised protein [uncultured archaeon]|nr:Uncharacterised protein [uncultured archaeon]